MEAELKEMFEKIASERWHVWSQDMFEKIAIVLACMVSGVIALVAFAVMPDLRGAWVYLLILLPPIAPLYILLPRESRTLKNIFYGAIAAPFYGGLPGMMLASILRGEFLPF